MDALHSLGFSRRPVAERVLLVFRTRPEAAARLLAQELSDARPYLQGGRALVLVSYTRLARAEPRWLPPGRPAGTHHLTYRVPLVTGKQGQGRALSFVLRRESSAWFGARWAALLRKQDRISSRFAVSADALNVDLHVRRPDASPLRLRTSHAPQWPQGLFRSRRELEEFLGLLEPARGNGAVRAAADGLLEEHLSTEPLEVHACEGALPFEELTAEDAELDCAVRMRPRILAPVVAGRRLVRDAPEASSAAPAL